MTLSRRVAVWTSAAALISLLAFAAAVYLAVLVHERHERTGDEVAASEAEEAAEQVLWAMLFAAPVSLALSVAGGVWVSRRAFRPLGEVTRAAREIGGTDDLGHRLEVDPRAGDLAELVTSFNSLLARLERVVGDLDQYAAHLSHEIRTPLATAIAELEISLRRPRSAEEWATTSGRVLDELRRLAELADELLQLARQASGVAADRPGFAIAELLAGLQPRAAAAATTRSIELGWSVPIEPRAEIAGSTALITSALWNMIDNALRYTPAGGRVEVRLDPEGPLARISVDDSGPGVAEEHRPSIFDPFVRDRAGGDGTGVGLAIARRAIEAHAGTIEIAESALGGARLVVALPIATHRNDR